MLNHYRNLLHKHIHGKWPKLAIEGSGLDKSGVAELTREQTGVLSNAMRSERAERTFKCIGGLKRQDRAIVILRGIEQCSNREAALVVGAEEGTTATKYHRALHQLQEAMPASIFAELPSA